MNTQNNEEPIKLDEEEVLKRMYALSCFLSPFSPKTVEEQFLLQKFTTGELRRIYGLSCFFTMDEMERVLLCNDPESCFDSVSRIVSRIEMEQKMEPSPTIEMQSILQRFHAILPKE